MADFPLHLEDQVYYCGFETIKTAGAHSYFIKHPKGNWLITSPKFQGHLVKRIEELGGIEYLFISHRDDAGEARKFAEKFGCRRIIHRADLECQPDAEIVLDELPMRMGEDFLILGMPGHTAGHCMLLYRDKFLFAGDSLKFDRKHQRVEMWDAYWTWYSYPQQVESVAGLLDYRFEWLLPSHGDRIKLEQSHMHQQLSDELIRARANPNQHPQDVYRARVLEYYARELRQLNQPVQAEKIEQQAREIRELLAIAASS